MRSLKEIGKNLCKRALSLTVSAALVCASIPLARGTAAETAKPKYLNGITTNATVASSYTDEGMYDEQFYNDIIANYDDSYASEESALEISTAGELAAFAKAVNGDEAHESKNFENKYIKLTDNIDLKGVKPTIIESEPDAEGKFTVTISGEAQNVWTPIDNFAGTFDGQGHEIQNMVILAIDAIGGFFGNTPGSINRVSITGNSVVYSNKNTGALVGTLLGQITNCYTACNVYASNGLGGFSGGLVGLVMGSNCIITSCHATGNIFTYSQGTGGLIGNCSGTVNNSYATGNIYGALFNGYCQAGGLVGWSSGSLSVIDCYATGNVSVFGGSDAICFVGGILGEGSSSNIGGCCATGDVNVLTDGRPAYAGGLAGSCASITNSYATGNIFANASKMTADVGSLVGKCYNISNSYAIGNVSAFSMNQSKAGGLVGDGSATDSYRNSGAILTTETSNNNNNNTINEAGTPLTLKELTGIRAKETMAGLTEDIWIFQKDETTNSGDSYKSYLPRLKSITYPKGSEPYVTMDGLKKFIDMKIEGETAVGQTLTAKVTSKNTATPAPAEVTAPAEEDLESLNLHYQWLIGGKPVDGATTSTFTIENQKQIDDGISVQVTSDEYLGEVTDEVAQPTYGGNPADFIFTVPTDEELIYDGTAKDAKVSAVPEELQDKITVKYYNSEGMIVDKAVDAGVYTVKIDVAATTNYGEVKNLTHPDWTFTIRKRDLNKNYFTFSAPSNTEYNGSPKNASVKLAENYRGVGAVTVKYYNAEGNEVEPINAGEYTVKIDVSTGANYNQAADLTADDWKFTIEKGTPCYTAPTGLAAKSGQKLSEIAFPESSVGTWQWADAQGEGETTTAPENTVISSAGTYKANFVPNDQDNYNTVENIDIFVTTGSMSEDVSGKVDAKLSENTYTYDGNEWKPTVTVKYYKDGVPTVTTDGTGSEENDATGETENSGTETTADEGVELIPGTDYTVTYPSDMTSVGTKPIIVNYKGAYSGYSFLTGEIKYLELGVGADGRPINPYIANGDNVYNDGETIWKIENGDVIITPPDGYTISDDFNSETYGDTLTITGEASAGSTIIYLKDADGHVTAGIPISEAVKNDMEGPKGVISINVSEGIDAMFRNFMNKVTFGLMFSDDRTATIAAKDSSSGVKSIEYIVAHEDLFPNDKENQTTTPEAPEAGTESGETPEAGTAGGENQETQSEQDGQETPEQTPVETVKGYTLQEIEDTLTAGDRVWQEYTAPIALERNNKYVVYAKLTDNVGNVTYINSSGIKIRVDATLSRHSIEVTKTQATKQTIDAVLNGNKILKIKNGDSDLTIDTDYTLTDTTTEDGETVEGSQTITFKAEYLNSLDPGNYTLTVESTATSGAFTDEPKAEVISLKVLRIPLTADKFTFTAPTDTAYNGQAKTATVTPVESINEGKIGNITLRYFEVVTKEGEPAEGTEGSLTELKELSGEPVIPGAYRVKIDVTAGTVYSSANELEPSTSSWNFTIAKSTASAELFEFHAPENLVYDTHEKTATVTPKDGVTGIGEITVKYYKVITAENGTKTYELLDSENPTSAGTYIVKIGVAAGEYYGGATDLEPGEGGWSFTIAKAYPSARDFNYTDPQSFTGK